jgi:GT2 family glycosyltransferase
MYGEDVDLSWKLAGLGRLRYCEDAVFQHDSGDRGWVARFRIARYWMVLRRKWGRPTLIGRKFGYGLKQMVTGDVLGGSADVAGVLVFLTADSIRNRRGV